MKNCLFVIAIVAMAGLGVSACAPGEIAAEGSGGSDGGVAPGSGGSASGGVTGGSSGVIGSGGSASGGVTGSGGGASGGDSVSGGRAAGGNVGSGGQAGSGRGGNASASGGRGGAVVTGGSMGGGGSTAAGAGGAAPVSTGGTVGAGGGAGSAALGFVADIWPVFSQVRQPPFVYRGTGSYQGCTAASPCHGSANPGARLSMTDADAAYRALFQVASTSSLCAGAVRVIPGNPDGSCLVRFYQGRLKDDLQWVPQSEIELMRRWIAEGARP